MKIFCQQCRFPKWNTYICCIQSAFIYKVKATPLLSSLFLFFNISIHDQIEKKTPFLCICETILLFWHLHFYLLYLQLHSYHAVIWCKTHDYLSQKASSSKASYEVIWVESLLFPMWFFLTIWSETNNILTINTLYIIKI